MGRNYGQTAEAERSQIQPRRIRLSAPTEADQWAEGVDFSDLPERFEMLEVVHAPVELSEIDAEGRPELVGLSPFTASEARRYATAILDNAGVKTGDTVGLMINAGVPEQIDAARMIYRAGFERGVRVEIMVPNETSRQRVDEMLEADAAFISLSSFTPPGSDPFADVDGKTQNELFEFLDANSDGQFDREQVAANWAAYNAAKQANEVRWNVAVFPTRAWAQSVYPELDPDEAYRQLGKDLRYLARCSDEDGPEAWREHMKALRRRAHLLNEMQVEKLEISGGGTELEVAVAEGADFLPCEWETKKGSMACVNTPTEEIFTTPDPGKASGKIQATKPFVWYDAEAQQTRVIEGVWARLEDGEVVEYGCADPGQERYLDAIFNDELGTKRIGELGLVGQEARAAQLGRTYNNTIIDENAGLHFGFGSSYADVTGGAGNEGRAHYDLSCGNDETVIHAVGKDGRKMKIMERGRWLI